MKIKLQTKQIPAAYGGYRGKKFKINILKEFVCSECGARTNAADKAELIEQGWTKLSGTVGTERFSGTWCPKCYSNETLHKTIKKAFFWEALKTKGK